MICCEVIHAQKLTWWQSAVRSSIMPGLRTYLVQKLNVGTVLQRKDLTDLSLLKQKKHLETNKGNATICDRLLHR